MAAHAKLNCIFVLLIIAMAGGVLLYYKQTHPKYVPPKIEPRKEINVTIIPGWNLRQIAADWTKKGIIKSPEEFYGIFGEPAYNYKAHGEKAPVYPLAGDPEWAELFAGKPGNVSYEGYFYPDTYRVYADGTLDELMKKIFDNLNEKITPEIRGAIKEQKKSFYDVLTMASVVQKETPTKEEMSMVADIFWRRYDKNWALQSCATVNYITGKNDPGVSDNDKETDSLFNTYKYPGLPLGAISNPGVEAIKAAVAPTPNKYWYFMSGTDGTTHWAATLDEHNANVYKYLR